MNIFIKKILLHYIIISWFLLNSLEATNKSTLTIKRIQLFRNVSNAIDELLKRQITLIPSIEPVQIHVSNECVCKRYGTFYIILEGAKCNRIPSDLVLPLGITELFIQDSGIEFIKRRDFQNLTQLETLVIQNNELIKIEPRALKDLNILKTLTISENTKFNYLEHDVFDGLRNLTSLTLNLNADFLLKQLATALSPKRLPALRVLRITGVMVDTIETEDLQAMTGSNLTHLFLENCSLRNLKPNCLSYFKSLKVLNFRDNELNTFKIIQRLKEMQLAGIKLKYLTISSNSIPKYPQDLLEFVASTSVIRLDMSYNQLSKLERFPTMPNILRLNLANNYIQSIPEDAFYNLSSLKILELGNNSFSGIPKAALLPNLLYLDLSYSRVCLNSTYIELTRLKNLIWFDLSGNRIENLNNNTFKGLEKLKYLFLKDTRLRYTDSETFSGFENLLYLNLKNANGIYKINLAHLRNLKYLMADNCKISNLRSVFPGYENLTQLEALYLSQNNIDSLTGADFKYLTKLRILDLSYNKIQHWDESIIFNNAKMKYLIVTGNIITKITKAMLIDFDKSDVVCIAKNPLSCTCEDIKFLTYKYLLNENSSLYRHLNLYPLLCRQENGEQIQILDYINTELATFSCSKAELHLLYTWVPLFLIVFFYVCSLVFLSYRWDIWYMYFLLKQNLCFTRNKRCAWRKNKKAFKYDAFVSYSNEDYEFIKLMVEMLEKKSPFLKLCVFQRDFEIGKVISESVLASIADSRKTLLVISDSYIESYWCRWEAQVADNHRLFFENQHGARLNDSIVLIKLGEIDSKKIKSFMLRYMMETQIYLQWDAVSGSGSQTNFWHKLRKCLNKPAEIPPELSFSRQDIPTIYKTV